MVSHEEQHEPAGVSASVESDNHKIINSGSTSVPLMTVDAMSMVNVAVLVTEEATRAEVSDAPPVEINAGNLPSPNPSSGCRDDVHQSTAEVRHLSMLMIQPRQPKRDRV